MSADDWIAVADALPTESGRYLVFLPHREHDFTLVTGYRPARGWEIEEHLAAPGALVTHWQHLPEPPHP